jgi:membrane protein implicated in regulation of membrane protease activity
MVWLAILVVMAVIEIITLGLTTIWFAGGALVAFVASLLGAPLPLQIGLFTVVSLVLLAVTRPIAVKYFNKDRVKTNAESLIGQSGMVLEEINNLKASGLVQVNGQEWTARTLADAVIPKGSEVIVRDIRGVKLMVEPKNENELED